MHTLFNCFAEKNSANLLKRQGNQLVHSSLQPQPTTGWQVARYVMRNKRMIMISSAADAAAAAMPAF
jgi:hypothetical protein